MKKYLQPVAKKSVDDSTAAEVNVTGPVGAGNKRKLSKEDADVSNNNNFKVQNKYLHLLCDVTHKDFDWCLYSKGILLLC